MLKFTKKSETEAVVEEPCGELLKVMGRWSGT